MSLFYFFLVNMPLKTSEDRFAINLYDMQGKLCSTLSSLKNQHAGIHREQFQIHESIPMGTYIVALEFENWTRSYKIKVE